MTTTTITSAADLANVDDDFARIEPISPQERRRRERDAMNRAAEEKQVALTKALDEDDGTGRGLTLRQAVEAAHASTDRQYDALTRVAQWLKSMGVLGARVQMKTWVPMYAEPHTSSALVVDSDDDDM